MLKVLCGNDDNIYRIMSGGNCTGTIIIFNDVHGRLRARLGPPRGVVWSRCRQVDPAELRELLRLLSIREQRKLPPELLEYLS